MKRRCRILQCSSYVQERAGVICGLETLLRDERITGHLPSFPQPIPKQVGEWVESNRDQQSFGHEVPEHVPPLHMGKFMSNDRDEQLPLGGSEQSCGNQNEGTSYARCKGAELQGCCLSNEDLSLISPSIGKQSLR